MNALRVGNAPVSWGVYEAHLPNPPFTQILDGIAQAGYEGTELGPYGYLPTDPDVLAHALVSRKLALGSSFVALPLEDDTQRAQSVAKVLEVGRLLKSFGVGEVICAGQETPLRAAIAGRVPHDNSAGLTDRQWKSAAATLHACADALGHKLGMRVVVHHHAATVVETPWEIDRLLAETDPERVNLLLDTGHAFYGGADLDALLHRHGKRIRYVHFKDVKPSELAHVRQSDIPVSLAWKRGVFCPLGSGMVDFPAVTEQLRRLGYAGWVIVEQDVVPDAQGRLFPEPFESAQQSRRYLRETVGI